MSIKSQRSLEIECSEIIERSYSVRTPSNDSLSDSEDSGALARELLRKLNPAALSKLRRNFKAEAKPRNHINSRVEEVMREAAASEGVEFPSPAPRTNGPWIDETGFVKAVGEIFADRSYSPHARQLFQTLDGFGSGRVSWRQLLDRMVEQGARRTRSRAEVWTPIKEKEIRKLEHCKRETIVKLVSIEQPDSFCYAAVTKGGRVGVYDGEMMLIYSYEVFYQRTGLRRRVKNCWITDAVYMPDVQYLILSASDRSLSFYSAASLTHTLVYCVTGLPDIPTCMSSSRATRDHPLELAIGTDCGDVIRMVFLQPIVALLYDNGDKVHYYFFMELSSPPHTSYVSITRWRHVHTRGIRRLAHTRDGSVLLSCSHDSVVSVRARQVNGKIEDYEFQVQRGVTCFQTLSSLHLLATGSADGIVRLWDITQRSPFARLTAPAPKPVLDVAVIAEREIVVAFCVECYLHIWDLYEECLLQTIRIRFPFIGVLGKRLEYGNFSIFPGPPRCPMPVTPPSRPSSPPLLMTSRRGSAVNTPRGGLVMQDDGDDDDSFDTGDREQHRFNRPDILLTCCDYICRVVIDDGEHGPVVPPPGDTRSARRPSGWDLEDHDFTGKFPAPVSPRSSTTPAGTPPAAPAVGVHRQWLSAADAEVPQDDLDTLLEKAGLQGILEKDFVLMMNLKSDLNKKLAEMHRNMEQISHACGSSAPHLAARLYDTDDVTPGRQMMEKYQEVMKLFPSLDLTLTPRGSTSSSLQLKSPSSRRTS